MFQLPTVEHDHLLSTHLLLASLAIKLICYQLSWYHINFTFICYQASFAIRPQLLSTHLLSGQLLSILSCNQQFCYQSSFAIKFSTCSQSFFSKNPQKNGKISQNLEFFSLWQTLRGQRLPETGVIAETMLREDSLATNVPNADLNKQRKKNLLSCQADLKKMVESYDNMPLGVYMNNIVRFFKDDWVII